MPAIMSEDSSMSLNMPSCRDCSSDTHPRLRAAAGGKGVRQAKAAMAAAMAVITFEDSSMSLNVPSCRRRSSDTLHR